ncbi:MAG: malonyl-ACP O-methyltransferase BioC [Chlorobium sp.]|jgi:malonyl-CoA O-methyltransferase|uniref:malonyl-ACP O-methyltransferase BioC n=1 Tax=Chlorobium sp. TaxID=1095 RepID=UPI001DC24929|nr:malonyl-ACP O-methyltransferase BioC [Chlorobium sp.]MBN1278519.1 malonyl-ACP O-methyltransferase BioC [Chlorobiaceae bacterium]MCF8215575.1 malonyl-ACP O-methyltransferase BioC [Chlorobium sp.]MCF8270371.1 malonyl-ACP O-methyltransferase BioC [Chlorobium sp.]MCF8286740.1 malonyl-ACP O-methyltransferase BioC [Chlorobium sp.]MCF8290262.1 malonyl-ACP O-methyltransferase BioC [Chlorobium sp.]
MQQGIDKQLVSERFAKALGSYREHAVVQREMAIVLTDMICTADTSCNFGRVLEVGAGTGALMAELLSRCAIDIYMANDIVAESRRYTAGEAERRGLVGFAFLPGDIETIEDLPVELDLVVSNATVQWLSDLDGFFRKMAACLKPGGMLAFSTFSSGNMREIAAVEEQGLMYPELSDLEVLGRRYFDPVCLQEELRRIAFDSPISVLNHVRKTGVNGIARRSWTKGHYLRFLRRYQEDYACAEGVYLTYHPVYCCFRKRLS